jgi:hypothetical protein
MKRSAQFWISALLLLVAASASATPQAALQAQPNEEKQITIRVRNYAWIESAVLSKAETTASRVLQEAGAKTAWALCLDGGTWSEEVACTKPPGPMDFTVNVLPSSMSQAFHRRGDVFGQATEDGVQGFGWIAWIFYDTIKSFAVERDLSVTQLLGHALAHELGHLLLGANSHSGVGLMHAPWSSRELLAADQGPLYFSASESKRIQKAVLARWQATSRGIPSTEAQQASKTPLVLELR